MWTTVAVFVHPGTRERASGLIYEEKTSSTAKTPDEVIDEERTIITIIASLIDADS